MLLFHAVLLLWSLSYLDSTIPPYGIQVGFLLLCRRADAHCPSQPVDMRGKRLPSAVPTRMWGAFGVHEELGVRVPFPVIADLDMAVATRYGMIHPGAATTAAMRSVFVID